MFEDEVDHQLSMTDRLILKLMLFKLNVKAGSCAAETMDRF